MDNQIKKLIERLLIFILGVPAVFALVYYLTILHNLPLNVLIIIFTGVGAVEFSAMLEKKQMCLSAAESFILGCLAPLAVTLTVSFNFPEWVIPLILMTGAGWALMSKVFFRKAEMETVIYRLSGGFSIMVYPGFFMFWLVKMNAWENPGAVLLFLFITFGSDSSAWLTGSLLGANNRGLISASPNKSIAGFIGGILGSVIVAAGAALLFPSVFSGRYDSVSTLVPFAVLLGFCTGIAGVLGDLAESAIKRSCDFKDSGKLMLGRGGILDSIDSIAAAAPVFYMLYKFIFKS
jgi:phosphatidate cytidylyltransferase